jgi:sigma-E factor negative regulatory protein RseA
MDEKMDTNELISALADGQLQGEAFAQAMDLVHADRSTLGTWHAYHLIGDVLRSRELGAGVPAQQFLQKVSARLAQEQGRPAAVPMQIPSDRTRHEAANDGSFRWKVVAGFASFAAVAAVGWSVIGTSTNSTPAAPQLAAAPQPPAATAPAPVLARSEPSLMIRDPRLDEFLAAHRQLGAPSALQMPAGFLRNATFEGPAR